MNWEIVWQIAVGAACGTFAVDKVVKFIGLIKYRRQMREMERLKMDQEIQYLRAQLSRPNQPARGDWR